LGSIGEIHPTVMANFGLEKPVYCFELDFERLVVLARQRRSVTAPSRFPDSSRDIAMLAPDDLPAEKITECVRGVKAQEIEQVEIFDLYRGKGIPEGFKSIAVRVRYRSYERTLTDEEIGVLHGKVVDSLVNKLKVSIR
jgi:phenylalanyl-tRNA synthetase beta chain